MGLAKLDDVEYARRARERNNRVNAAHRQRLLNAGKAQTNVWLSADLRARLEAEACADGVSLSVAAEALLMDGLAYRSALATPQTQTQTPTPTVATATLADTVDMFGEPANTTSKSYLEPEPANWTSMSNSTPRPKLTQAERDERDQQILELHRQLGNNHEVGRQLGCSEATVRRALKQINAGQTADSA